MQTALDVFKRVFKKKKEDEEEGGAQPWPSPQLVARVKGLGMSILCSYTSIIHEYISTDIIHVYTGILV